MLFLLPEKHPDGIIAIADTQNIIIYPNGTHVNEPCDKLFEVSFAQSGTLIFGIAGMNAIWLPKNFSREISPQNYFAIHRYLFPNYGGDGHYEFAREFAQDVRKFAQTHTLIETHDFAVAEFNIVFDAILDLQIVRDVQDTFFTCAYVSKFPTLSRKLTHVDKCAKHSITETLPDAPAIAYASICPTRGLSISQTTFARENTRDPIGACIRMLAHMIAQNPGKFSGQTLITCGISQAKK